MRKSSAGGSDRGDNNKDEAMDTERRSILKKASTNPEDEEFYVSEDGAINVARVDDKSRIERLRTLLDRREREIHQAAEYGLRLLEANESLELQVEAMQIQLDNERDERAVELGTYQRRHSHLLLEVENWKRKYIRLEEEKDQLQVALEQAGQQCICHQELNAESTLALHQKIVDLEFALAELQQNERSNVEIISALKEWKATAENQLEEAQDSGNNDSELHVKNMEEELSNLRLLVHRVTTENDKFSSNLRDRDDEIRQLKKKIQDLEDKLVEKRVECSAHSEALLTAEAKCSRFQRELALLEEVSYLSLPVIDRDNDDDDDDDGEEAEGGKHRPNSITNSIFENAMTTHDDESNTPPILSPSIHRTSLAAQDMPTPYTAFPTTTVNESGVRVALSPSDFETHTKLHHYFHLTAQSIIHENDLHEQCFKSSSRYTIDMWYREIIAKDIPFLQWHSWLINRISEVAASFQNNYSDSQKKGRSGSGLASQFREFGRRIEATTSPVINPHQAATPSNSPSSKSPVSFSVIRAFFRLLGKRDNPEDEFSSDE